MYLLEPLIKDRMEYSEAQQKIIDRYLEATKDCPEDRIPLEKLVGLKNKFPKSKPDKYVVAKCERELINDDIDEKKETRGRKARVIDNLYVRSKLTKYKEYEDAAWDYYWLDDVFTGVCSVAFEGATRWLSKYVVFDILSTAYRIDNELIADCCNVNERQVQKIMTALIVCNRAIEKELKRMDDAGLEVERRVLSMYGT